MTYKIIRPMAVMWQHLLSRSIYSNYISARILKFWDNIFLKILSTNFPQIELLFIISTQCLKEQNKVMKVNDVSLQFWFSNLYIFTTWWCKSLIFLNWIICSNRKSKIYHNRAKNSSAKQCDWLSHARPAPFPFLSFPIPWLVIVLFYGKRNL